MSAFKRIPQKIQQLDTQIKQSPYGQAVTKYQNAINFIPKQIVNSIYNPQAKNPMLSPDYQALVKNPRLGWSSLSPETQQGLINMSIGMAGAVSAPGFSGKMGKQLVIKPNKLMDRKTQIMADEIVDNINFNKDMRYDQAQDLRGFLRGISSGQENKIDQLYVESPNKLINEVMRHVGEAEDAQLKMAQRQPTAYTIDTMPRLLNPFKRK